MIATHQKIRIFAVFTFFCTLYGIIIVNLFYIQIKRHDFFSNLAHKQYHVSITRSPARAPIIDRNGNVLATNKEQMSAFIVPNQLASPETLQAFLAEQFPEALERMEKYKNHKFMFVKRKLSPQEIQCIKAINLPDLHLISEPNRYYPSAAAGQLVGITNIENKGLFGIEMHYESLLAGTPRTYTLEKDARSGYYHFKKETTVEGSLGKPIQLTIDSNLQFLALEELKKTIEQFNAKEGSVLIMDPITGDILVMVSMPSFDPNNTSLLDIAATKNRTITETYELGSVFKVFTALAALEENVTHADEPIDCHNKTTTYLDGRKINTWKAHGTIPFSQVIESSNNIGIAIIAKRLHDKLYDHLRRLGFGKKVGIPFPGEQNGFVNPPHNWSKQSIISLSYGYEVTATLLQLARAFCIIANGGYSCTPRLIMNNASDHNNDHEQLYRTETIDVLKEILRNTTLHGTARRASVKGYNVMSKTGTANLLENGTYTFKKNIYTCAGIVEKDDYKRVIVVSIKESPRPHLYASQVSAPLFERIAEKVLIHDKVL